MKTTLYNNINDLPAVAELLRGGQVVAIPTETVYGLAANALNEQAVRKIFAAKNRPADNPLIVHIATWEELLPLVKEIPPKAKALADAFWPGPLTMVLPRSEQIPNVVTAGGDTVAVRMPAHDMARAIIKACGLPLAAPSANRSGSPSPTTAAHVMNDMDGVIPAVFDGGMSEVGLESTVISLVGETPRLLRPGGITPEQLQQVVGAIEMDPSITANVHLDKVSSPGMKYKHYAPKAKVTLLHGSRQAFVEFVNQTEEDAVALCFAEEAELIHKPTLCLGHENDPDEIGHNLFALLRLADEQNMTRIYAHCPARQGVGLAVYNRLIRAAAFDERELETK
ncbi:MAG: threonylcarbamoyl-AMP synthase [Clostridia bacterium]|nr:threonylcarbamoyl-AMP synthase [Clostridia bacterium]